MHLASFPDTYCHLWGPPGEQPWRQCLGAHTAETFKSSKVGQSVSDDYILLYTGAVEATDSPPAAENLLANSFTAGSARSSGLSGESVAMLALRTERSPQGILLQAGAIHVQCNSLNRRAQVPLLWIWCVPSPSQTCSSSTRCPGPSSCSALGWVPS